MKINTTVLFKDVSILYIKKQRYVLQCLTKIYSILFCNNFSISYPCYLLFS